MFGVVYHIVREQNHCDFRRSVCKIVKVNGRMGTRIVGIEVHSVPDFNLKVRTLSDKLY